MAPDAQGMSDPTDVVLQRLQELEPAGAEPPEPAQFFFQAEPSHGFGFTEPSQAEPIKMLAFSS